jgi:hypothetical protein
MRFLRRVTVTVETSTSRSPKNLEKWQSVMN